MMIHAPFPPSIGRTGADTATSRLLATWMSLIPTLQVWPLSQRCTTRPWHRSLLHCEIEPSPCPGIATPLWGKRLRQTMEDCCWACARDQLIQPYWQASLGATTSLRLWRKGNCETLTSWHCLETELNTSAKIQAEFPTCLDTSLSKMSWTLRSNSCTSDAGIMPPSESGTEERVLTRTTLRQEMSCSVSRVAWAAAPMPV